jgi:hypothetical protein
MAPRAIGSGRVKVYPMSSKAFGIVLQVYPYDLYREPLIGDLGKYGALPDKCYKSWMKVIPMFDMRYIFLLEMIYEFSQG